MNGLTPERAREFLERCATELDDNKLSSKAALAAVDALGSLPEDDRRRWLRGRRAALRVALHGGGVARSTAYYLSRLDSILVVLVDAGLVTNTEPLRDARSGRKVKSVLGELARIDYRDDADLVAVYERLRDKPLPVVKATVVVIQGST